MSKEVNQCVAVNCEGEEAEDEEEEVVLVAVVAVVLFPLSADVPLSP